MSESAPISARVTTGKSDQPGVWLPFPATKDTVQSVLRPLGDGPFMAEEYACRITGLERLLPTAIDLNELNFLADRLAHLDAAGESVLEAVLASNAKPDTVCDLINLCANTDCFELYPHIRNPFDLGISRISEAHAGITELVQVRQDTANGPILSGYLSLLEEHFDYAAYGRVVAKEEGGIFTQYGYLCRNPENMFLPVYDGTYVPQGKQVLDAPVPRRESSFAKAI